jgi:iron complex outermembrane recepter protein
MRRSTSRGLAFLVVTSPLSCMVWGQESPAPAPPASPATGSTAAPLLEEVIVTAERRPENLQRTAISINSISGQALTDAGATSPTDLSNLVPGVTIAQVAGLNQITIRGVSSVIQTAFQDSTTAFSVDGVFASRPTGADGVFFDVSHVEVLKGPQGTLYGRNATGGAINVITNKPVDHYESALSLQGGNFGDVESSGMLNLPLSDTLSARGAFQTVDHNGYYTAGYDDAKNVSGRMQLLYQPSLATSLLLSSDYFHEGGTGAGDVPINATTGAYANTGNPWQSPPAGDPLLPADQSNCVGTKLAAAFPYCYQRDGSIDNTNWRTSAQLDYNAGFGTFTFIPAYRSIDANILSHPREATNFEDTKSGQTTLEARLASNPGSQLEWLVGTFYLHETQHVQQNFYQFNNYPHPPYTINNIVEPTDQNDDSTAVFTQETWPATSDFRVTAGARYTDEYKNHNGVQITNSAPTACAAAGTAFDAATGRCTISESGTGEWRSVQWRAGVEYDVAQASMLYANVSTGQHAGGFFQGLPPNTYRPEKLTAYALGSKNRFLDEALQVNVEVYYWNYQDLQVTNTAPLNPSTIYGAVTLNAGRAVIYGVEPEVEYALTENDLLTADLAYMHTNTQSFQFPILGAVPVGRCHTGTTAGTENCSGVDLLNSPEWSGTLRVQHTFKLGAAGTLRAMADTHLESRAWLGFDESVAEERRSYHKSDAELTYDLPGSRSNHWSLSAYINNLEDTPVRAYEEISGVTRTPWVFLLPPRTYGLRINVTFD